MKLEFVWPVPVIRQWSTDRPVTIERLPIAALKSSVRRIQMTYQAVTLHRKMLGQVTDTVLWQIRVVFQFHDGSVFESTHASSFHLEEALDCAHFRAMDAYFESRRQHIQKQLVSTVL